MEKDVTASRWTRLLLLRAKTGDDHEWSKLYDDLVRNPMLNAPQDRAGWHLFDPEGILDRLERAGIKHGLIDSDAPALDPGQALAEMVLALPPLKDMP